MSKNKTAADKYIERKTKQFNSALARVEEISRGYRSQSTELMEKNFQQAKEIKELQDLADLQVEAIRSMMKVTGITKEQLEILLEEKKARTEASKSVESLLNGPFGQMLKGNRGSFLDVLF